MQKTPNYPAISRVMRVQPRPDEKPASGFSRGDYEDISVDHERTSSGGAAGDNENDDDRDGDGEGDNNDGWGIVKSRGRTIWLSLKTNIIIYFLRTNNTTAPKRCETGSPQSSQSICGSRPVGHINIGKT
ncbi:hypothetical protein PILCRDRAFT_823823 [Piloderma croceum F 1598]|uniref:Uncharacterized protein n=1 Tax=Piloderma croceum (strain F 1598) TaxID=765440 RepID=A0A0C3BPK7_PILCF|nr:hypothetical protein PILCRDRAFT_823823 [Piloderma croceum F 1598]